MNSSDMPNDCTNLTWCEISGRFEWSGKRCKPAIEAEISSASYDVPWIEFGDLSPTEVCKRWNYHDKLILALTKVLEEGVNVGGDAFEEGSNLIDELERTK